MLITVRNPDGQSAAAFIGDEASYFDSLVAGPYHWRSYSLRDQAQLTYRDAGGYANSNDRIKGLWVTYSPGTDTYPNAQDAAKIVIPAGGVNLPNQVRVPLNTGTEAFVLTWDAWYGPEYAVDTGIPDQKTWQLQSGGRIWTEVRNRFTKGRTFQPGAASLVDVRAYSGTLTEFRGAVVDGVSYGSSTLAPQVANFAVQPSTWTRYFVHVTPREDGSPWWDFSLWMADETRDPIAVHAGSGIQPADANGWEKFWIEFNTSSKYLAGRGDLVAYVRNVVLLHHLPADVSGFLVKP